jgi:hypothetical protein
MSEQLRSYWAGNTTGKPCDVPDCPHMAKITKRSQADEKIRLCQEHQNLTPEQVIEQHTAWLASL